MSDNTNLIADSIGRILSGGMSRAVLDAAEQGRWPTSLWKSVEEAGFTRVLMAESEGGTGGGWVDAYPVLHSIGHERVPLPLAETLVGNGLLTKAGLPVAEGACALIQQRRGGSELEMTLKGDALVLNGRIAAVPWASQAAWFVIAGRAGDKSLVGLVDASDPSLSIERGSNFAFEPQDSVSFADCRTTAFTAVGPELADAPVLTFGALARAVQMAGALQWLLAQTLRHAREREQFGRPLANFQAVKQMLAVLASEVVAAATAAQAACEAVERGDGRFEIAVAKVRTGQAVGTANLLAHQIHGAMGFTYEHTLHVTTRRLWSWRADYGNEAWWAMEIGKAAISRGGDRFWEDLTAR